MKKEHIMTDEEKIKKRKKIEQNRAKKTEQPPTKIKREHQNGDLPPNECNTSSNLSFGSPLALDMNLSSDTTFSNPSSSDQHSFFSEFSTTEKKPYILPSLESSPTEIINSIIQAPGNSSQAINHLMKTPEDAIEVISKILNSPKDAVQLISHVISAPGDALKIISKIMNSPLDALTIFTKFMSSPTGKIGIKPRQSEYLIYLSWITKFLQK